VVLDREVGDAAARVELVGRDDRARRADVDAALAGAAMLADRRVAGEVERDEELAQEEERARVAREQQRVLAAPAEARCARERTSITGALSVKTR
jgi:hypothetical protein